MIHVYINYPNTHISIHKSTSCGHIQQQRKASQRVIRLNSETIDREMDKFSGKFYRFAAEKTLNDMWLILDFEHEVTALGIVADVKALLERHYSPFRRVKPVVHCEIGG